MSNTYGIETSGSLARLADQIVSPDMTQAEANSTVWQAIQADQHAAEAERILRGLAIDSAVKLHVHQTGESVYWHDLELRQAWCDRHNLAWHKGEYHPETQTAIKALDAKLKEKRINLSDNDRFILDEFFGIDAPKLDAR